MIARTKLGSLRHVLGNPHGHAIAPFCDLWLHDAPPLVDTNVYKQGAPMSLRQLDRHPVGGFLAGAQGAFTGEAVEIVAAQVKREIPSREAFAQRSHFARSEEHTSELQSRLHLVCRLLLEKKKKI